MGRKSIPAVFALNLSPCKDAAKRGSSNQNEVQESEEISSRDGRGRICPGAKDIVSLPQNFRTWLT